VTQPLTLCRVSLRSVHTCTCRLAGRAFRTSERCGCSDNSLSSICYRCHRRHHQPGQVTMQRVAVIVRVVSRTIL